MRLKRATFLLVLAGLFAAPSQARADWFLTPYIGANFGGDSDKENINFGGSLGYMGAGIIGFEVDFGYSPNFWDVQDVTTVGGNVTTGMVNLIIGAPIGGMGAGVRPYASGGVGLIRSSIDDVDDFFDVDDNSFGMNVGAGIMGFMTDNVGIRGDVRYFRSIADDNSGDDIDLSLGDFDFWRASFGVAFRF